MVCNVETKCDLNMYMNKMILTKYMILPQNIHSTQEDIAVYPLIRLSVPLLRLSVICLSEITSQKRKKW